MTLLEAIQSNPSLADVPEQTIEAYCVSRAYESSDEYSSTILEKLELVTADLYLELATQPDVKEGQLALSYNRTILLRRARNIYLKYGDPKATEASATVHQPNITKI